MNIFTKLSIGSFSLAIAILLTALVLVGCGSSRIMLNAEIPESQEVEITIETKNEPTE